MQGGFKTEERGGVEVKVVISIKLLILIATLMFWNSISGKRSDADILAFGRKKKGCCSSQSSTKANQMNLSQGKHQLIV